MSSSTTSSYASSARSAAGSTDRPAFQPRVHPQSRKRSALRTPSRFCCPVERWCFDSRIRQMARGCDVDEKTKPCALTTLLPCPHCGGEAQYLQHDCQFWIQCKKCYGVDGQTCVHSSERDAVDAWNRRITRCMPIRTAGAAWMTSELRERVGDGSEAEDGFYAGYLAASANYGSDAGAHDFIAVMSAWVLELERKCDRRGNAPGHGHAIPGVWDEDNGALAGKPCAWCALWAKGKAMLDTVSDTTKLDRRPAAPESNWIKCSEQLPEIDAAVFLQCADGEIGIAARCDMANGTWEWGWAGTPPFFNRASARWDCQEYRADDVDEPILWMPLPATGHGHQGGQP